MFPAARLVIYRYCILFSIFTASLGGIFMGRYGKRKNMRLVFLVHHSWREEELAGPLHSGEVGVVVVVKERLDREYD